MGWLPCRAKFKRSRCEVELDSSSAKPPTTRCRAAGLRWSFDDIHALLCRAVVLRLVVPFRTRLSCRAQLCRAKDLVELV
ncbi:unnamed protein product [Arabidopsis thaliana]|uniref:Uncharacterized protein n=1 Tax=Arabidopsis thaliana TaxID=3702 RepID=A0A5S9XRV1_ARATH|nr:unnamed protein product [Arabidopsis thaliana]